MKSKAMAALIAALFTAYAAAQPAAPIPSPPPGTQSISLLQTGSDDSEVWSDVYSSKMLRNVTHPTLTPVLPDPAKATGAAVVVAPGGAFMMLSMENEGWKVARWLADHGIAAFVLKYRLDPTPADNAAFQAAMGKRLSSVSPSSTAAPSGNMLLNSHPSTDDGLAAIRLVRSRAAQWRVDPKKVGIVGFSAGAMLAVRTALASDPASRPDFVAPIYPPLLQVPVPADAPPAFVAIAGDDTLFGKRGFGLIEAWQKANRPIEFHMYEKGGHGFGMGRQNGTSDLWIDQFYAWMKGRGLLAPATSLAR
jgi:acetyl esterase/lipase